MSQESSLTQSAHSVRQVLTAYNSPGNFGLLQQYPPKAEIPTAYEWFRSARKATVGLNEIQDLFLLSGSTVWRAALDLCRLGNVLWKERFLHPNREADREGDKPKEPTGQESLTNPQHGA